MFPPVEPQLAQLQNINRLLDKRDRNGGWVIGFHGTSASRAEGIIESGFENRTPIRGGFSDMPGVYFWDEEYANNALAPGRNRAQEDGDRAFAVVEARLHNPAPDYEQYRPQWRTLAEDIGLLAVRYYDLATGEMQKHVMVQ